MKRNLVTTMVRWLDGGQRKPLVIRGARQVGKTWVVRELARVTGRELIEVNFERVPDAASAFSSNDPASIILALEALFGKTVKPGSAILFLDEIQAVPEVLGKLRWFAEEMSELPVIAAGSLLDFLLEEHTFSMPVGRISYLHLEPMSFTEFLFAKNEHKLVEFLEGFTLKETIPLVIHNKLWEQMREYCVVGGMPEAVKSWVEEGSLLATSEVQQNLLMTYRDDFAKYRGRVQVNSLEDVLKAVPKMVGQKFKYVNVTRDLPAGKIKNVLDLLCKARICTKVNYCDGNGIPLAAGVKSKRFKVVFLDVGLVSSLLGLSMQYFSRFEPLRFINEGQLAEQLVGQLLRTVNPQFMEPALYYWAREEKGSEAEIDYLIQHSSRVVPLEVKAGSTGRLASLHLFVASKGVDFAVRINSDLPSVTRVKTKTSIQKEAEYTLLSIPLYLTEYIHSLLAQL